MGIAQSSCVLSETAAVAEGRDVKLELCFNGLMFCFSTAATRTK